ncbi:tryptophan--tRNA ligase [Candidatus Parcubacteria bacterium]|nr:tryptophan--tRNA ligase [Candidatus Parcubacteria bacterium]
MKTIKENMEEKTMKSKVEILTGIRPTGDLTVANYLGAVKPILQMQKDGKRPMLFVADLHAMTTNEPMEIAKYSREVIADYLALGVDTDKTTIYLQSDIAGQTTTLMTFLARHISVAELLRVPTLKEKMKTDSEEKLKTANALLFLYPVMMAADILLQQAKSIPVGEDQVAHLEVTRKLANRFNKKYGDTFPVPQLMQVKALRLLSLKGDGKMSKSNPSGAIFLTDSAKVAAQKIKKAETAIEGKMTPRLESHVVLAKKLCKTENELKQIDELINQHKNGKPVMGLFKQLMAQIVTDFLQDFQSKRAKIKNEHINSVLAAGAKIAQKNADETLNLVKKTLFN